jgi:hypothetical protein
LPWAALEFDWLTGLVDVAPLMPGTAAAPCTVAATLPYGAAVLAWAAAFPCGAEAAGAVAPFPGIAAPPGAAAALAVSGVAAGDAVAVAGCVALGVGVAPRAGESADIMPGTDACPPDDCDPEGWGADT